MTHVCGQLRYFCAGKPQLHAYTHAVSIDWQLGASGCDAHSPALVGLDTLEFFDLTDKIFMLACMVPGMGEIPVQKLRQIKNVVVCYRITSHRCIQGEKTGNIES